MCDLNSDPAPEERAASAETTDGPFVCAMKELAQEYGIWTVFGMREPADAERSYNTTVVLDDAGRMIRAYRKTHLYDAFSTRESDTIVPGSELFEPFDTPFARIGLLVCYEMRFPEIARDQALKGAELILMPTAWVRGRQKSEHLRLSVAARALENTVFVAMCDMCGGIRIGESAVAGPLGEVIAQAGSESTLLIAEIDTDQIAAARKVLPVLENRRPELYR